MIKKEKVDTYRLTKHCDKCGSEMINDGRTIFAAITEYNYHCASCKSIGKDEKCYPIVFYEKHKSLKEKINEIVLEAKRRYNKFKEVRF